MLNKTLLSICFIAISVFRGLAQPVITNFSPKSATVGTQILISGSNFSTTVSSNVVYFGPVKASIDSAKTNALYVKVPAGARYSKISVTVAGRTALTASRFNPLTPCAPSLGGAFGNSFVTPSTAISGLSVTAPRSIFTIVADLDLDGKVDLITTTRSTSKISVHRNIGTAGANIGSGTFATKVDYNSSSSPTSVQAVDFDLDGYLDLVTTTDAANNQIAVLRNTSQSTPGSISFAAPVAFNITGLLPNFVTGADIDGDARPEIIVACNGVIGIMRNTSTVGIINGSSFTGTYSTFTSFGLPSAVDVEDLDLDGKLDIAVACSTSNNSVINSKVQVFRNLSSVGTISMAAAVDFNTTNLPFSVKLADMDGDAKPDMVCSRTGNTSATPAPTFDSVIIVYRNTSSGAGSISFATPVSYGCGVSPGYPDIADIDGDNKPDVIVPVRQANKLTMYKNNSTPGTISLGSRLEVNTTVVPYCVNIADLNADNIPDILTTFLGTTIVASSMSIYQGRIPQKTIVDVLEAPTCPGNQIRVAFSATTGYGSSNVFTVQMSDSTGDFSTPTVIGSKTTNVSDTITATIPANTIPSLNYRVRLVSSSPLISCADTGARLQVKAPPVVSAGADATINIGDSTQLNASGGNSYNWNTSSLLSDTLIASPYAKPYLTTDFVVAGIVGFCRSFDTVKVTVTQNINRCTPCSPEYIPHNQLLACFPFDKTGIDESGNANHLFFNNIDYGTDRLLVGNSAALFNGAGNYFSRPNIYSASSDSATMMGWFFTTNSSQRAPLFYAGNNGADGFGVTLDDGASGAGTGNKISMVVNGSTWVSGAPQLTSGFWNHIALVKAGNAFNLYVNGNPTLSTTATISAMADQLLIGGSPYTSEFFNGKMDDLRFFSRALSQAEISKFISGDYKRFASTIADDTLCQGDSVQLFSSGGSIYRWSPAAGISDTAAQSPFVKPVTAANSTVTLQYIVKVTRNFCFDRDTVRIRVDNYKNFGFVDPDTAVCLGGSINIAGGGGLTYTWSPAIGLSATNIPNPNASPIVSTDYVLKTTRGICADFDTITIRVDNYSNFANAGNDTTICIGSSVRLNASGGNSYDWRPVPAVSNKSIPNPITSPSTTTNYFVKIFKGACLDEDTVQVKVDNFVNFGSLVNNDSAICLGGFMDLYATGASSYLWTPSTNLSADNIPSPQATPTTATLYKVKMTLGACVEYDSVEIKVDSYFNFATAQTDADSICAEQGANLSASGGDFYLWSPSIGLSPGNNLPNVLAEPLSTTTYKVTATKGACEAVDSVTITVVSSSSSSVDAGRDTTICAGDLVYLNAKGAGRFAWNPPVALSNPNIPNPVANPLSSTKYMLIVTDSTGLGCKILDSINITVKAKPVADIFEPVDTSICEGTSILLKVLPGGPAASYLWLNDDGTISNTAAKVTFVSPLSTRWYTVRVRESGCESFDSVLIGVLPKPIANLGADKVICLNGDSLTLTVQSAAIISKYQWNSLKDTSLIDDPRPAPRVLPVKNNIYTVKIFSGDCESELDTVQVRVVPSVDAEFEVDPVRGTIPFLVNTSNKSIGGDIYSWDFGDTSGVFGTSRDTSYGYFKTGIFRIILKVESSAGGCVDYDTNYIAVDDFVTLFVPSAFSPNKDGLNDTFKVSHSGLSHFTFFIYNRWGEIIYEHDSRKGPFTWDGTYKGEPLADDIFYYYIDFTTLGDKREYRSGSFYLKR